MRMNDLNWLRKQRLFGGALGSPERPRRALTGATSEGAILSSAPIASGAR